MQPTTNRYQYSSVKDLWKLKFSICFSFLGANVSSPGSGSVFPMRIRIQEIQINTQGSESMTPNQYGSELIQIQNDSVQEFTSYRYWCFNEQLTLYLMFPMLLLIASMVSSCKIIKKFQLLPNKLIKTENFWGRKAVYPTETWSSLLAPSSKPSEGLRKQYFTWFLRICCCRCSIPTICSLQDIEQQLSIN